LPVAPVVPGEVARAGAIRRLNERIAPLANVGGAVRLLVSGCRPGDGASSVAAGVAIDLSQRLGMRTVLADANLRHPTLHRLFAPPEPAVPEVVLGERFRVQATGWPRLEVVSCLA